MRKSLLVFMVICLAIAGSTSAQMVDYKGQNWLTGHLGYAFGMGNAFSNYTDPSTSIKLSSDAGIGFGGQYYFGLKKNLLIGGEVMFQRYSATLTTPANLALSIPETEISASTTESNFIVNTLYAVNQSPTSALFFMGGAGLYDFGGMELGLNTGLTWRKKVGDNMHIFGMPRLHVVLIDDTPMMFQLTMGAQFSL